jgi:hypothetical protein
MITIHWLDMRQKFILGSEVSGYVHPFDYMQALFFVANHISPLLSFFTLEITISGITFSHVDM